MLAWYGAPEITKDGLSVHSLSLSSMFAIHLFFPGIQENLLETFQFAVNKTTVSPFSTLFFRSRVGWAHLADPGSR